MEAPTPAEPPTPAEADPSPPGRLSRVEIALPDGRYLLLYSRLPPPPKDA